MKAAAPRLLALSLVLAMGLTSGCSIFIGSVKPLEERTKNWNAPDLAKEDPTWKLLSSNPETPEQELSDVAYQSSKTGSIISLNSACRTTGKVKTADLKELRHQLLLGVTEMTTLNETETAVDGNPGLRSEVTGALGRREVHMMTVITQRTRCIFDMMYVAQPAHFDSEIQVFERFLARIRLN